MMASRNSSFEKSTKSSGNSNECIEFSNRILALESNIENLTTETASSCLFECYSLNNELKPINTKLFVDSILVTAKVLIKNKNLYEALTMIAEAASIAKGGAPEKFPRINLLLAVVFENHGANPIKTKLLIENAIQLCGSLMGQEDLDNKGKIVNCLAYCYLNSSMLELSKGNEKQALEVLKRGIHLKEEYPLDFEEKIFEKYQLLKKKLKLKAISNAEYNELFTREAGASEGMISEKDQDNIEMHISSKEFKKFQNMISHLYKNKHFGASNQKFHNANSSSVSKTLYQKKKEIFLNRKSRNIDHMKLKNETANESLPDIRELAESYRFIKRYLTKKKKQLKIRSEYLNGYLAYNIINFDRHLYLVTLKTDMRNYNLYSDSSILGNLVELSAYALDKNAKPIKESCYIFGEILELLGIYSLELALNYNQVNLLSHVEVNAFGRIVLKQARVDALKTKRMIYKDAIQLNGENYTVKIFESCENINEELEIKVYNKEKSYDTKKPWKEYYQTDVLKRLCRDLRIVNDKLTIKS